MIAALTNPSNFQWLQARQDRHICPCWGTISWNCCFWRVFCSPVGLKLQQTLQMMHPGTSIELEPVELLHRMCCSMEQGKIQYTSLVRDEYRILSPLRVICSAVVAGTVENPQGVVVGGIRWIDNGLYASSLPQWWRLMGTGDGCDHVILWCIFWFWLFSLRPSPGPYGGYAPKGGRMDPYGYLPQFLK